MRWRWQHQGIPQLDEMSDVISCDNFDGQQASDVVIDMDLPRMMDEVVQAFERYFHQIVLGIVRNPKQREPISFHLIPERQRGNLNLCALAHDHLRKTVEEWSPLVFI